MVLNLSEKLKKAAVLQDKEKTMHATGTEYTHPQKTVTDVNQDLRDKVYKLEVEKRKAEERLNELEKSRESRIAQALPVWENYKQITVRINEEDYDGFKSGILDRVKSIAGPVRANTRHTHNPWFRAAFSNIISRLDKIELGQIKSEDDIEKVVNDMFKPFQ
jgi:hypothetical protein